MSSVTFLISSLMFTDETFPIDSGVIITTYPVSWVQCVVQVLMLCVRKWPSMLPSPLPLPNTGPSVQQQDCCSEEYKGESAVLPFHFRRSWCELVVLCKPASWSSLLVPPLPPPALSLLCAGLSSYCPSAGLPQGSVRVSSHTETGST